MNFSMYEKQNNMYMAASQGTREQKKRLEIQAKSIMIEDFPKNLFHLTSGIHRGNLYASNIDAILFALGEAKNQLDPHKMKNKTQIEPLDFDLNQSEVIYLFDILITANLLKTPKAHEGSYWRKLETYFTASGKSIRDAEQKKISI